MASSSSSLLLYCWESFQPRSTAFSTMSASVNEYMRGTNLSDDHTMMAIRYNGCPKGGHNDEPEESII